MKTDDILNLDCTKSENKNKINRFLYNIKPINKIMGNDKTKQVPLEVLEETLHGVCIKYKYEIQNICPYYEQERFVFYVTSIIKTKDTREWVGNTYGKTMWELLAKSMIKIYSEILKERNKTK